MTLKIDMWGDIHITEDKINLKDFKKLCKLMNASTTYEIG